MQGLQSIYIHGGNPVAVYVGRVLKYNGCLIYSTIGFDIPLHAVVDYSWEKEIDMGNG